MPTRAHEVASINTKSPDTMIPVFRSVNHRDEELDQVITLEFDIETQDSSWQGFKPGQFNMLYAFGIGEVAISMSGNPAEADRIVHTIRAVGAISRALTHAQISGQVGIRGPFGNCWPLNEATGRDVLIVAGGLGLAPLRPALYHLLEKRERYGRIALIYGSRNPAELLYADELELWNKNADIDVHIIVDHADKNWRGNVGLVTRLIPNLQLDWPNASSFLCGPEIMMRSTAISLLGKGMTAARIYLSMERNMKCAIALCGHCQYGPHFVCKDGPIFSFQKIRQLLSLREI